MRCKVGGVALTSAVVVTVSVAATGEEPVRFKNDGETVQVDPGGPLPQVKFSVPVSPFRGLMASVADPDCPGAEMLIVLGFAAMLKSVTVTVAGAEVEGV